MTGAEHVRQRQVGKQESSKENMQFDKTEDSIQLPAPAVSSPAAKLGLFTLAGAAIVCCQIGCEIGKQLSNYSIQYYNGGNYPLPQTILVVLLESLKLVATIMRSGFRIPTMDSASWRKSTKFLLPSLIYAVNNNIYLAGLLLVPPPIWIILCSFRTVVTASLYKFVLKREVTVAQFTGAFIIVISIVVAKLGDLLSLDGGNQIPMLAIVFAIISSFNSVGAAVYTESLFKTSGENFLDQQFWLYFYGMLVAGCVHLISTPGGSLSDQFAQLTASSSNVQILLVIALLFGSLGGLVVAAILKMLDNVVKEYSSATANIITAILCSRLFPEKFSLTPYIVLAMLLLFVGIYMYERKPRVTHETPGNLKNSHKEHNDNTKNGS